MDQRDRLFTCECADTSCVEQMQLTASEYEEVRSKPDRFAVLPGHVYPEVEDVVYEKPQYVIVEKIGAAARVAREHDPRSAASLLPQAFRDREGRELRRPQD
jgi:hypothetical protein